MHMQTNERKIRKIRDKLTRIGINETDITDKKLLSLYDISANGQLCGVKTLHPREP